MPAAANLHAIEGATKPALGMVDMVQRSDHLRFGEPILVPTANIVHELPCYVAKRIGFVCNLADFLRAKRLRPSIALPAEHRQGRPRIRHIAMRAMNHLVSSIGKASLL